jgi:quinone-modifying oxidoreductase, subunit QmoC
MNLERQIYNNIINLEEISEISKCIQCGTCSGSCPLHDKMEHTPRGLFALIRDYEVMTALSSNTMWYCVSCYACTTRCPRNIPITGIMYRLKEISQKHNIASDSNKIGDLYQAFNYSIKKTGKANETLIMRQFALKNPKVLVKSLKLGIKLLQKKRLPLTNRTTKTPQKMKNLFHPKTG